MRLRPIIYGDVRSLFLNAIFRRFALASGFFNAFLGINIPSTLYLKEFLHV
ncbi:MAG: hypothetical protein GW749_05260 [Alphaproteobacteria bacterium]|nr:hypothetical protein [Alphaproteobacteria bacterium]